MKTYLEVGGGGGNLRLQVLTHGTREGKWSSKSLYFHNKIPSPAVHRSKDRVSLNAGQAVLERKHLASTGT